MHKKGEKGNMVESRDLETKTDKKIRRKWGGDDNHTALKQKSGG
jgi:hypothetical protein